MNKDIFGFPLYVGDEVAFIDKHENKMRKGKITDILEEGKVRVVSFDTPFKEHYFKVSSKNVAKNVY